MLKGTKAFQNVLGTIVTGQNSKGIVILPGNANAVHTAENSLLSTAVKFGFSKHTTKNSNYLTFSMAKGENVANTISQLKATAIPRNIGSLKDYAVTTVYGDDLVLSIAVTSPVINSMTYTYDITNITANIGNKVLKGIVSTGSLAPLLSPQDFKVWRLVIPAIDLSTLITPISLGFTNALNTNEPFNNISLADLSTTDAISAPVTSLIVDTSDFPSNIYSSMDLINLNVNITAAPYLFCWKSLLPTGDTKTITTVVSGVTSSNVAIGGVNVGSTVTYNIKFSNVSSSTYVITSVEVTNQTQSITSLTNTAATFAKDKVAGDFTVSLDSIVVPACTGNALSKTATVTTTLAPLDMINVVVKYLPLLKVTATPSMIVPYVSTTAPTLATVINNNRKVQVRVYGYLQGGSTTPIPLGDAIIIKASVN